jgi:two-component system sensor histidine kinase BaeS
MRSLRSQLALSHIIPFLVVLPLLTLALLALIETQVLLADLSQRTTEQATLLAQAVRSQLNLLDSSEQAQAFVARLDLSPDGQIVLLSADGRLLAAAGAASDAAGQTLASANVAAALQGQTSVLVSYGLEGQRADVLTPVRDGAGRVVGAIGVAHTLTGVNSVLGRLRLMILATLLLEILLGVALGVLAARRLARPIDATAHAVIDLAAGRPMETIAEEGPREIRQLAAAANNLAEQLRLLEETRRRSLANVVHEIGRPLGAVRSALHVLRGPAGDDVAIREELLGGAEAQIERMQPLLDDLTQLHSQVSGSLTLHRQPVALGQWLPPLLLPWRAAALEQGLDWQMAVPGELPTLQIDPGRLAQVLDNLLSNAIKYTPAGGYVAVSAGMEDARLWIRVADSGPGIAAAEQQRVFEPFYRSERQQRFPQGLGLGLTIARDLVVAHGGELTLESQPGEGSCFTLYLPLQSMSPVAQPAETPPTP